MRTVALTNGEAVPALGLGTWHMGERGSDRAAEADALRCGIDLGMTLIDTAEMYGTGGAEEVVGDAVRGRRDQVFLVSKVLPFNADRDGTVEACEASLRRLGVETIDLYLLHWPGSSPLEETLAGFDELRRAGKIRHWGVSNFDTREMGALSSVPGGAACATNQVLYNLSRRGIEFDLLPWCRDRGMPVMAYSPLEQGRLHRTGPLAEVAGRHGVTEMQVALAWVLSQRGVIAIPKASRIAHVRQNRAALDLELTPEDIAALDRAFPPPSRKQPLDIL
jgi:diketogulonate reductase-like aldo/keto reductase